MLNMPLSLLLSTILMTVSPSPSVELHSIASAAPIQLIVKASPQAELESRLSLDSNRLQEKMLSKPVPLTHHIPVSDTYIEIRGTKYVIDNTLRLFNLSTHEMRYIDAQERSQLQKNIVALKAAHYGRLLTWSEAKPLMPLKSILTVTDLETGLHFNVQRRAGSTHADVQPLTRQDTTVMKKIYSGKWSWKRRAVLVKVDGGDVIAGSMHGMPHGGDGIPDNGFNGHFCIHFLGSSTHGSDTVDPDHQTMVLKAAGQLQRVLDTSSPEQLVNQFIIALNQQDNEVLNMLFPYRNHDQLVSMTREASRIVAVRRLSEFNDINYSEELAVDIPVRLQIYYKGSTKREQRLIFEFRRSNPLQPWKIEHITMKTGAVLTQAVTPDEERLSIQFNGETIRSINRADYALPATTLVNQEKLMRLINELSKQLYKEPRNAKLSVQGQVTVEQAGLSLDQSAFTARFLDFFYSNRAATIEAPMLKLHPKVDRDMIVQLVYTRIGSYVTHFNPHNKNRAHNIALAAKALDSYVVFPGELFSFNQAVGIRTKKKGYLPAKIIVKGEYSEGIGGGICQVSSTLFNAVDRAGLEIVQRYSHSRHVPYVLPGRDATVSWYGPDFTFYNQYNQPILIRANAASGAMTIAIFSTELIEYKQRHIPGIIKQKLPKEITVDQSRIQVPATN